MSDDLAAAICLVLILEGLFLFAGPEAWKRMAMQMQELSAQSLRAVGGGMMIVGLLLLQVVR